MRRVLPSAQWVRSGSQSECSITYKDGSETDLIYSHNRGGDDAFNLTQIVNPSTAIYV